MITRDDVVRALKEVIAERGEEYRYTDRCYYSPQPGSDLPYGCAVGGVIQKLDPEAFAQIMAKEAKVSMSFKWNPSLRLNGGIYIDITPEADSLLSAFQIAQDAGIPYGVIAMNLNL